MGNITSATAIGSGLAKPGSQPNVPSRTWTIISPQNGFAGAQEHMNLNQTCLPHLDIPRLQQSGPEEAFRVLRMFQQYLGLREQEVRQGGVGQGAVGQGAQVRQVKKGSSKLFKRKNSWRSMFVTSISY